MRLFFFSPTQLFIFFLSSDLIASYSVAGGIIYEKMQQKIFFLNYVTISEYWLFFSLDLTANIFVFK